MTLININKLKESAGKALKDASEWTSKAAKDASNWTSQAAKEVSSQTSEPSSRSIRAMLKGVDLDDLLVRIDEYQQKTGKNASKLAEFIGNLKNCNKMEQEKNEKMTMQKLAQSVPLADVLDIAEDVAKYVPATGGVIQIVIKILRLLLTIKK